MTITVVAKSSWRLISSRKLWPGVASASHQTVRPSSCSRLASACAISRSARAYEMNASAMCSTSRQYVDFPHCSGRCQLFCGVTPQGSRNRLMSKPGTMSLHQPFASPLLASATARSSVTSDTDLTLPPHYAQCYPSPPATPRRIQEPLQKHEVEPAAELVVDLLEVGDGDAVLRAFANTCRHRGAHLGDGAGGIRAVSRGAFGKTSAAARPEPDGGRHATSSSSAFIRNASGG